MAKEVRPVRLQIVVDSLIADRLEKLAEAVDRTPSKIASNLIEEALVTRSNFHERLAARILAAFGHAITGRQKRSGETTNLQVFVTQDTADKIDLLASSLNNTAARVAALLLDEGVTDGVWLAELLGPSVVKFEKFFKDLAKSEGRSKGRASAKPSPKAMEYPCW